MKCLTDLIILLFGLMGVIVIIGVGSMPFVGAYYTHKRYPERRFLECLIDAVMELGNDIE